jgi:hypothetical protein
LKFEIFSLNKYHPHPFKRRKLETQKNKEIEVQRYHLRNAYRDVNFSIMRKREMANNTLFMEKKGIKRHLEYLYLSENNNLIYVI